MKAKNKKTGEIIDIEYWVSYLHKEYGSAIKPKDEFINEFEILDESNIDWEQRKYELAKDLLTSIITSEGFHPLSNYDKLCYYASSMADSLINNLKNDIKEVV